MLLALFVKPLVHLLFGNAYQNVVQTVLVLLPGIVIFSCARVLANDIAARGRPGINIWTTAIALAISVIANIFLIPRYGISGAALGVTLTFSLATMINMIFYSHISRNRWLCPLMIEDIDRRLLLKLMSYTGFLTKN
jgi:O-antigen/teichoic acid export membrane protein